MNADKTDKKCPKCGKPVLKKTVRSKKNGKEYVVFECSDGKWDAKEKKKTGCDYSKFA